jgi:hypothetical protein
MTGATIAHHAALALAVAALIGAGLRAASALGAPSGLTRAVAACSLAAAAAVTEALGLGLVSLGGSAVALTLAALATWTAAWRLLPARSIRARAELAAWWRGLPGWAAVTIGALLGAWGVWTLWLFLHPALGRDMVLYHLPEAVTWVHDGRPGSIAQIITAVPVGSYPLTHEVLLEWGVAIGRSFVWATLVTAAMPALVAAASWLGLRTLRVGRLAAGLAAAAIVAPPAVIASQNGGATLDPAALAWLTSCAALCAAARTRAGMLVPALAAAGLAVGSKTTTAPLAIAVLATAAFASRRRLRALRPALAAGAALAVATGGVWYARNLLSHGWPLWPFSSAPWGDPRPRVIAAADVSFIDRPGATLSRLGGYYWDHFGGPLVLFAGALAAPLVARRRAVTVATIAAAVSVLLWMNAPFTGVLSTRAFDVGTGDATRYLMPGAAAAAVAVALATLAGRLPRRLGVAVLGAAVVVSVHDTFSIGFPGAPRPLTPLAGALLGAVAAAGLVPLARGRGVAPRLRVPGPAWPAAGAVTLALAAILGAVAADGYVKRHGSTHTRESRVAGWFAGQAAWRDGDGPVASTWSLVAPLAGDRLEHRLVLVRTPTACRRAASRSDWWLVLDLHREPGQRPGSCGPPAYADGDFEAYAPGQARVPAP